MEVELNLDVDTVELKQTEKAYSSDLLNQIEKVQSWVQNRISQLKKTTPSFSFAEERSAFIKFMQTLPAGSLSVHCQTLWVETEKKLHNLDQKKGIQPKELATQKERVFKNVQAQIARAVFASERSFSKTVAALEGTHALKGVDEQFNLSFKQIAENLHAFKQHVTQSGIEDPNQAYAMRLAREIAGALLTAQGQLNLGIIGDIKAAFFPKTKPLLDFEIIIQRVLDQLDFSWQPLVDQVVKPNDEAQAAMAAIRADLTLAPDVAITDLHAKQAVLAALLSHHCQGPVGDCFAVAFAIKLHNEFLKNAFQQYGELLQFGSISKEVDGKIDRFFFKNTIANNDLQKPITLDLEGKLPTGVFIWNTPNFKFAFRQMGISQPQNLLQGALKTFGEMKEPISRTADQIIQAFARASIGVVPGAIYEKQLSLGRYGFSLIDNRVLRAFETALAGMAEAKRTDYVRGNFLQAVQTALQPILNRLERIYTLAPVCQVQTELEKALNTRIRYVYDAAIQDLTLSSDGSSTAGGFELYDRNPSDPYAMGTRIVTPLELQNLILDTAESLVESASNLTLRTVASAIASNMRRRHFLKQILFAYDPSNRKNPDPIGNYQQLARTPMTSQNGDDPIEVEQIDTGLLFSPHTKTVDLKNASDLLAWVLGLAFWKEKTERYLESTNPDMLDPVESPQHAFNLCLDIQEIVEFVKSEESPNKWIQNHLLEPNLSSAQALIDPEIKQRTFQALTEMVEKQAPNALSDFQKAAAYLNTKSMSLSQFAKSTLAILAKAFPQVALSQISLVWDTLLLQTLPASILQPIQQSAIRFALTNWNDGVKDIYFCVFFNPRTEGFSLGIIDEDRTNLSPMDETQWLNADWSADVTNELAIS